LTIPVVYGGEAGPDLGVVAQHSGLSEKQVVQLPRWSTGLVYWFSAGISLPGRVAAGAGDAASRRTARAVPAGSVGIGGAQTGIYPLATPGGWQLLGRTALALFDPARKEPALLRVGDKIRFVPQKEGMLTLIRAGLYTSVQDGGREGLRQSGISRCGALDYPRW
jgi:KipI family sensor histidine kinase inhibitor